MSSPPRADEMLDEHEPYRVARRYLDALTRAAFSDAAGEVRTSDLEAFQQLSLAALASLDAAHGDDDGFQKAMGASADELARLAPAVYFARFLAVVTPPGAIAEASPQLTIGRIDQAEALLRFRMHHGEGRPVRLVREGGRWWMTLHDELSKMRDRVDEEARDFTAQRALDRATFTDPADLFPVCVDDAWGFIDRDGVVRIAPRFRRARDFADGLAPVRVRTGWGFIDGRGELVVPPQFDDASELHGGYAVVGSGEGDARRYGVVDARGALRVPIEHDAVNLVHGTTLALCARAGWWRLLDVETRATVHEGADTDVEAVRRWSRGELGLDDSGEHLLCRRTRPVPPALAHELEDVGLVRFVDDQGRFGFMDARGKVVLSPRFERALPFSQGLAAAQSRGAWGFVDARGAWIIPPTYFAVDRFAHGIAPVARDGLTWAYADRTGRLVTRFDFASAGPATRGLARVTREILGAPGYLRPDGTVLWAAEEPE